MTNIVKQMANHPYRFWAMRTFLIAVAYFMTGKLGSLLAIPPGYATVIWPPSGIALAAVLSWGYRASWGILLGCFLLNLSIAENYTDLINNRATLISSSMIAFGATLQAITGRFLLKKFTDDMQLFTHEKSIFQFMFYAGILSSLVNSSLAVSTLFWLGKIPKEVILIDWSTWWIGDAIGIFIFTPILSVLFSFDKQTIRDRLIPMSMIFICTFSLITFLIIYEIKVETTQMKQHFDNEVKDIKMNFEKWLGLHINSLRMVQSFYLSSQSVEKKEFQSFVAQFLESYHGIDSFQWIAIVEDLHRIDFENAIRQYAFSDFFIKTYDNKTHTWELAQSKHYYAPITFAEPLDNYRSIIGFDALSHPQLQLLLQHTIYSQNNHKIWISSMMGIDEYFSSQVLSFIPVFRQLNDHEKTKSIYSGLDGFVVASLDISHLIEQSLGGRNSNQLQIRLFDRTAKTDETDILFSNAHQVKPFALRKKGFFENNILLVNRFEINFANRYWQLEIQPTQHYFVDYRAHSSWFILLISLLLTSLVGGFVMVSSGRRYRLQQQVTQTTHALEESEIRFKMAFEYAPIGVANISIQGYFLEVNQGLSRFLGYSPDELTFITHFELTHPADRSQEAKLVDELLNGQNLEFVIEKRYRNKIGHFMWANLTQRVIFNAQNEPDYFVAIIEDINERKIIEKERAEFSLRAIRELEEQKKMQLVMEEAKRSAEALAKSKSEFLANMSHEIRTPMNAIIGFSDLALDKEMPDDVRDYIVKIHQSSENLLRILNDILDVSKIEAGKLTLELAPFNLVMLSRNLYRLFSETAKHHQLDFRITIDTQVPTNLIGDNLRLEQILSNLISNAIKFTVQGKVEINIELINLKDNDATIRFSVMDTGIGIKKEIQSQLFTPFTQADSSITRRFGGTGLGLTICKKLLTLMGGDNFRIKSIEGQGTTIYFDLNLGLAPSDTTSLKPAIENQKKEGRLSSRLIDKAQHISNIKVLLAEDNILNQEIICNFLALSSIATDVANNGLEAIELLEKHSDYDAILMDVNMEEMGGIEATKHIRQNPHYQWLPIIALTAAMTTEEQQECFDCGMNDIVGKPVNPEQLLDTLARWTQKVGD